MRTSLERSLARLTVPLVAVLSLALALIMPNNERLWDAVNRALPSPPDNRVAVVGIDDASLRDYGPLSGWPTELYGQALRTLDEAGARAIGIDLLPSDLGVDTATLSDALSRPNVVFAAAPDEAGALQPTLPTPDDTGEAPPTGLSVLNLGPDDRVRSFQTAYRTASGALQPSFARQLAVSAGQGVPLDTTPRILRFVATDRGRLPIIPFRDLVNGNVRFAELQGRIVLIGLTTTDSGSLAPREATLRDVSGQRVPGVLLQGRAVSSLLSPSFVTLPLWVTAGLCVLAGVGAVLARRLWGFVIALAALSLALPLWLGNVLFPGMTVSLAAILGTALVALERWWNLRHLGTRDPLTGLGNRLAFTRAVEQRWPSRAERPVGLLLVDLSGFRRVNDTYGRAAGDELLRDLAGRIGLQKRRGDVVFRWGPDEFAVLLDNTDERDLALMSESLRRGLQGVGYRDVPLGVNFGGATTGPDIGTPEELIEAASRGRYRMKYGREARE